LDILNLAEQSKAQHSLAQPKKKNKNKTKLKKKNKINKIKKLLS
jgi:hypothetical protein